MTHDVVNEVKNAMSAFETFKTELAPKLGKLDTFDEAKFNRVQEEIANAIEFSQKNAARLKAAEEAQKEREQAFEAEQKAMKDELESVKTALARPGAGASDREAKQRELAALGTKAFNDFARSRSTGRLDFNDYLEQRAASEPEFKALSVGSDPNGGYLVMPEFGGVIQTKVFESSPIRQLASVATIGTDAYEVVVDYDEAAAAWVSETGTRSTTNTPTMGKIIIPTHELAANPKATQKVLEDAVVDMETWLTQKVADKFARSEANAFVAGDGVGKPRGLLSYTAGTTIASGQIEQVNSGSATTFTYDGLVDLQNSLKEAYQSNAVFLIKRSANAHLMKIKTGDGHPIFNMVFDKNVGTQPMILGKQVYFADDVPAVTGAALAMIYGDIRSAYQIVDRRGITVLRDPYTDKPFISFYTTKRVGGGVMNFEAVKIGKIAS